MATQRKTQNEMRKAVTTITMLEKRKKRRKLTLRVRFFRIRSAAKTRSPTFDNSILGPSVLGRQ